MIKQILYTAYGEIYMDTNPNFQIIIGYHGGLYDPLTKLVHMGRRDYDVLAGRWTSPDHELWKHLSSSNIMPFNLYMFKNNNPISNSQDIKCFMTGEDQGSFRRQGPRLLWSLGPSFLTKPVWYNGKLLLSLRVVFSKVFLKKHWLREILCKNWFWHQISLIG